MISRLLFIHLMIGCVTLVTADVLPVPYRQQENNQWCWAGCSEMILDYFGKNVSQTEIAQVGTGGTNDWNYTWTGTSGTYNSDAGKNVYGINIILNNWSVVESHVSAAYTETEVSDIVNSGNPFVARWGWDTQGGHFVVGIGLENGQMHVNDPWYSGGYIVSTYDWLSRGESYANGSMHTWTHSLRTTMADPRVHEIPVYSLTVEAVNGRVERSPASSSYDSATVVDLTAIPDSGWIFAGWTGDITDSTNPVSVDMMNNMSLAAIFVPDTALGTSLAGGVGLHSLLQWDHDLAGADVQIVSVDGRVVREYRSFVHRGVDCARLSAGIYLVRVNRGGVCVTHPMTVVR